MNLRLTLMSVLMIMSSQSFADDINGSIRISDGSKIFRIEVGDSDQRNSRGMVERIKKLERAVRALQNRVYDLEDLRPVEFERKFECSFTACRESSSIHDASAHNCGFFKMWKTESISVWAEKGSSAETLALSKIANDSDIKFYNSLSCN